MRRYLDRTLMTVTALNPVIGYENTARAARLAHESNITLKEGCLRLGFLDAEHFDDLVRPENMV
jgi:fumarate hydratase class II